MAFTAAAWTCCTGVAAHRHSSKCHNSITAWTGQAALHYGCIYAVSKPVKGVCELHAAAPSALCSSVDTHHHMLFNAVVNLAVMFVLRLFCAGRSVSLAAP